MPLVCQNFTSNYSILPNKENYYANAEARGETSMFYIMPIKARIGMCRYVSNGLAL